MILSCSFLNVKIYPFSYRENDEEVGIGEVDDRVSQVKIPYF